MSLAKTCYSDYGSVLPQVILRTVTMPCPVLTRCWQSEYQYQLQGLNLLCLLAQSKIAEFHTELELIPVSVLCPRKPL